MAGSYAAIAISLALNLMLTRALGAERYGALALLLTASQIAAVISANWSTAALVRFASQDHARGIAIGSAIVARATLVGLGFSATAALTLGFAEPVSAFLGISPSEVWLVLVHSLATVCFFTVLALFQATDRLRLNATGLVFERIFALLFAWIVVASGFGSPVSLLAALALSPAVATLLLAVHARIPVRGSPFSGPRLADMWRFSLPLVIYTWAGFFGSQWIDYVFVRAALSFTDLGLYALAYQVAGVVQQVTIVASTLLLPRFSSAVSSAAAGELRWLLDRVVPYWLFVTAAGLSMAIVFADGLVVVLFGDTYAGAVGPLRILLVATMALAIVNTMVPLLIAHGSTWAVTRMAVIGAATNVVLDAALVGVFGTLGVAVASLASYVVSAIAIAATREVRVVLDSARPFLFLLPVAAAFASTIVLTGPMLVAVATIASGLLLATTARSFGLFTPADIATFRARAQTFVTWGTGQ